MDQILPEQRAVYERLWGPAYELKIASDLLQWETQLLQSPPFQGCDNAHIWEETEFTRRNVQCQDRSQLVRQLTLSICFYKQMLSQCEELTPLMLLQRTVDGLTHFDFMLQLLTFSQQKQVRRRSREATTPRRRRQTLEDALAMLRDSFGSDTPDDYARLIKRARGPMDKQALRRSMSEAFEAYGPAREDYSQAAMYYALAAIMIHCGIEKKITAKILAERLLKQVSRTKGIPAQG